QLQKPGAQPGSPDLALTKIGPAFANAGEIITYTLNYTNSSSGTSATGAAISDTLPTMVTFVSCSDGCSILCYTLTFNLGDLSRGASGTVTYQVKVADSAQAGQTFQNDAVIVSAEDDLDFSNNSASVVTTISSGCVPPTIAVQPVSAAPCTGHPVTF